MDWVVLFSMVLILSASSAVFWLSTRRWTVQRLWVALADWCNANGFKLRSGDDEKLPPALAQVGITRFARVVVELTSSEVTLVQVETIEAALEGQGEQRVRWNLLVKTINGNWPATGLRPAHSPRSVVDWFSMSSYSRLARSERFIVYGIDTNAAANLAKSSVRNLMPPDVGLVVVGASLVLDFSSRPFDSIEFGRMIGLVDQVGKVVSSQ